MLTFIKRRNAQFLVNTLIHTCIFFFNQVEHSSIQSPQNIEISRCDVFSHWIFMWMVKVPKKSFFGWVIELIILSNFLAESFSSIFPTSAQTRKVYIKRIYFFQRHTDRFNRSTYGRLMHEYSSARSISGTWTVNYCFIITSCVRSRFDCLQIPFIICFLVIHLFGG